MRQHQLQNRRQGVEVPSTQRPQLETNRWRCSICCWDWASKPKTECPGLPRYDWNNKPGHLQSLSDLNRQNLCPSSQAVGCIYLRKSADWLHLYDVNDTKIANPELPPIYTWDNKPDELKTPAQLQHRNLKPGSASPKGCVWHTKKLNWVCLYILEDCEVDDPNLPPYIERDSNPELKTEEQLKELNLKLESTTNARGYYRYYTENGATINVLLYHPDDCKWEPRDRYITKSTLRQVYLLSDGWIKRLGEPDLVTKNPHHRKLANMQLYSKQRVEAFLADNAEEYARWLDERDRYIIVFELNRKAIAAGRVKALESQRLRREQTAQCLRCASGCATDQGFLCAIHPKGLELWQIPCQDWIGLKTGHIFSK